jgi:GNAT superfamily N-acetyltransferase
MQSTALVIRPLQREELEPLLDLYMHLFTDDDPLPERKRVLAVWDLLQNSPWHDVLGVELDGSLVASCTLTLTPNLARATRPWGQIENVVTHSNHRRRGLGQALIRQTLEIAWEKGCYKVMLLTGRPDVHHFYELCGFQKGVKTGFVAHP